jgi:tetratricopeptide (TPR) repeat protein
VFSIAESAAAVAPIPTPLVRDLPTALERAQRAFERGHLREASELLEQALVLDASHIGARTMLAVAYARTRRVEQALEHLEAALALAPGAFAPRCALGELYLRLGIPDEARPHLARALEVASSAAERSYVEGLLKEDRARERRRMPRPSFRAPFWLFRRGRGSGAG